MTSDELDAAVEALPPEVRAAFAAKHTLTLKELARAFSWDVNTLRGHCRAGTLGYRSRTPVENAKHIRRVFMLADVAQFWCAIAKRGERRTPARLAGDMASRAPRPYVGPRSPDLPTPTIRRRVKKQA